MSGIIDIYPPIMSTRSPGMLYTAQGLGDRTHLVSLAFQVSQATKTTVRLHLAGNHTRDHKRNSFLEILGLFPSGYVILEFHEGEFNSNLSWSNYLKSKLENPKLIGYSDHPGWMEKKIDLDASPYLKNMTLLAPECGHDLRFDLEHIVFQWDSTGADRLLPQNTIDGIESKYLKNGEQKLVVGGQSNVSELKDCLACAAKAISTANYFVGVDSGFMHLAFQLIPIQRIHLYSARNRSWSHHLFRAMDNGATINYFGKRMTRIELLFLRFRYDSPGLARLAHNIKRFLRIERNENHD